MVVGVSFGYRSHLASRLLMACRNETHQLVAASCTNVSSKFGTQYWFVQSDLAVVGSGYLSARSVLSYRITVLYDELGQNRACRQELWLSKDFALKKACDGCSLSICCYKTEQPNLNTQ